MRNLGAWGVGVAALLAAFGAEADSTHPFHEVTADSVDLVTSVAWSSTDAAAPNREYLTNAFRQFASRTQRMTLGNVSVCNVYVYFNKRHFDVADIVIEDTNGRSNADLGGLRSSSFNITMYRSGRSETTLGNVMAHEFGHYAFALGDEYVETTNGERAYTQSRVCDTTLKTVMGDSTTSNVLNLSVPGDYTQKGHVPWVWAAGKNAGKTTGGKENRYSDCSKLKAGKDSLPHEDAKWRTAQWRAHKQSAWETLINPKAHAELPRNFTSPKFGKHPFTKLSALESIPTDLTPKDWDESCFNVIFMEGSVGAVFFDSSLSMNDPAGVDPDPKKTKFEVAMDALLAYIDGLPAGNAIAVYKMGIDTEPVIPVTWIQGTAAEQQAARTKLKADLQAKIKPYKFTIGSSSMSDTMLRAFALLFSPDTLGARHYGIVFSDGSVIPDQWAISPYTSARVPIFTIALGSLGDQTPQYESLPKATRGRQLTYLGGSINPKNVLRHLEKDNTLGTRIFPQGPKAGEPAATMDTDVTAVDGDARFGAYWSGTGNFDLQLVAPDKTVITPTQLPAGVSFAADANSAFFDVDSPASGRWQTVVIPPATPASGELELVAQGESPLGLTVNSEGSGKYPEPWIVTAGLATSKPVVGAVVVARFSGGPTAVPDLPLADDGENGDELAGDGIYSALVSAIVDNGTYPVEVQASNDSGKAQLDSNALGHGSDVAPVPIAAFQRKDNLELKATEYHDMPQTSAAALQVRNDLTPLWGTINSPGDVVWYKFNGYATGTYRVMTGNLVANDAQDMRTKVTLYDADGSSELQSDAQEDGRAGFDVRVPPADQTYYLKVEHPGQGIGRFQIAVAPAEWFNDGAAGSSGGGDSGGGCAIGGEERPGQLLVLLALAGWIVRRRRARA